MQVELVGLGLGHVAAGARLEQRRRDGALGRNRLGGRLLERRVDVDAGAAVVDVGHERLVLVSAKAAVADLDVPVDDRRAGGAGDGRVGRDRARQTAIHQHQRLELREVEVLRLDLDVTRRRLPLQRERAAHVERLRAADQPHILELDPILGVLDGGFRARRAGPLHALRPDRESRQVHFLVIGMENQLAGGVELAALFLDVRGERQPFPRERRLGGDRVQLQAANLDESGGRLGLHLRLLRGEVGHAHAVSAVQIQRVVLAVTDVAAVERAGGLQQRGVAAHRAIEGDGAADIRLTGQFRERCEIGGLDVVLQVGFTGPVQRHAPGGVNLDVGPADLQPLQIGRLRGVGAVNRRRLDLQAADHGTFERDGAGRRDRVHGDWRRDVGDVGGHVERAGHVAVELGAVGQRRRVEVLEPALRLDPERAAVHVCFVGQVRQPPAEDGRVTQRSGGVDLHLRQP